MWQAGRPGGGRDARGLFRGGEDLDVEESLRQSKSGHSVLLPESRLLNLNCSSDIRTKAQSEMFICPSANFPGV